MKLHNFLKKCVTDYQLEDYDEWAQGKKHNKKQKPLKQESEEASKVKIKTTILPPGSLNKIKKQASEAKKQPRDATVHEVRNLGEPREDEINQEINDESQKEDL